MDIAIDGTFLPHRAVSDLATARAGHGAVAEPTAAGATMEASAQMQTG